MKIKADEHDALNRAFAEHVAGIFGIRESTRWEVTDPPEEPIVPIGFTANGDKIQVPEYTRSADAVLPWLEKFGFEASPPSRDGGYWGWLVYLRRPDDVRGLAPTFPHAAVIALLRAHGVEIED